MRRILFLERSTEVRTQIEPYLTSCSITKATVYCTVMYHSKVQSWLYTFEQVREFLRVICSWNPSARQNSLTYKFQLAEAFYITSPRHTLYLRVYLSIFLLPFLLVSCNIFSSIQFFILPFGQVTDIGNVTHL
jgi:hypothetical protein